MGQRTKRTPNLTAVGDIDLTEPESKVATPKKQEATKVAVSRSVSRHKPNQKNDEYTKKREKALQELRKNEGLDSAKPKQKLSNAEYTALRRSRKVQVNLELDLIEKVNLEKLRQVMDCKSDQEVLKKLIRNEYQKVTS